MWSRLLQPVVVSAVAVATPAPIKKSLRFILLFFVSFLTKDYTEEALIHNHTVELNQKLQ
jgi:hypothetical protein